MGKLISNVTERGLYENENKADNNLDTNAHLLLSIFKNISLVLEDLRSENNKYNLLDPIPSTDERLRQENYIVQFFT